MNPNNTVSIQIPSDAQAGDTLTFDLQGTTLEINVPPGAQVGDVLQVQLATTTTAGDDSSRHEEEEEEQTMMTTTAPRAHDKSSTTVPLWNKCSLEVFSAIPSSEKDDSSKTPDTTDGTHAHIWSAAMTCIKHVLACDQLCSKLHDDHQNHPGRVLELGSGTGLLGLAYCMRLSATKATFVLSDYAAALPLLRYNVEHNRPRLPSSVTVECQTLDWTDEKTVSDEETYDLILGSDLLYNTDEKLLADLADTMHNHLKVNGKILFSVRWRKPESERLFFRLSADRGIEWSLLYSPQGCELNWDEFGNPMHEASNRYFLQRTVAVNGELRPLADLDEAIVEKLSDEEHDAFEQSFLQVYLGKRGEKSKAKKRKHED